MPSVLPDGDDVVVVDERRLLRGLKAVSVRAAQRVHVVRPVVVIKARSNLQCRKPLTSDWIQRPEIIESREAPTGPQRSNPVLSLQIAPIG